MFTPKPLRTGALGVLAGICALACTERDSASRSTTSLEVDAAGCLVTADRDGDGVERTFNECGGSGPQTDYREDCDDMDASRSGATRYYTDADGDGYGTLSPEGVWGCGDELIPGFTPYDPTDCDDEDATRQVLAYVDADRDGSGSSQVQCVGSRMAGFAFDPDDCDDTNPNLHPGAEEDPLDEFDADCDGFDFPVFYGVFDHVQLRGISEATRCEGAALSIVAVEKHRECRGAFSLQVGNRGSLPVDGGSVRVEGLDLGESEEAPLGQVGPGEVVRTQSFGPAGHYAVTLVNPIPAGNCAPRDETARLRIDAVACE